MINPAQIPPEVRDEVAKAIYERWRSVLMQGPPWEQVDADWRTGTLGQAEAAIIALFESWPGMQHDNYVIVLPQEASNDNR